MRIHPIFIAGLCLCINVMTNGQVLFEKYYGSPTVNDWGQEIILSGDNVYTLGTSQGIVSLNKLNLVGDTIWTRTFGDYQSWPEAFVQLSDGGFAITGSHGTGTFLHRTGEDGFLLWSQTFENAEGLEVRVIDDAIYVGNTAKIIKLDMSGNLLWEKLAHTKSIVPTYDGHLLALVNDITGGFSVKKVDSANGNFLWTKTYTKPGISFRFGSHIEQTTDGQYIITGRASPEDNIFTANPFLLKINILGDTTWTKMFGDFSAWGSSSPDDHVALEVCQDGTFALLGAGTVPSPGWTFIHASAQGDTLGTLLSLEGYTEGGYALTQLPDGDFLFFGTGFQANTDMYLVKYRPTYSTPVSAPWPEQSVSASLYPNPTYSYLRIEAPMPIQTVKLYNATGQCVHTKLIQGQYTCELSVESLPPGQYAYQIIGIDTKYVAKGKFIRY